MPILQFDDGRSGAIRNFQRGLRLSSCGVGCAIPNSDCDFDFHLFRPVLTAGKAAGRKAISPPPFKANKDDLAAMNTMVTRRPLIAAGTALGIGMGGFVDGIVLHQLLQVHNMLSAKYPTRGIELDQLVVHLQINMFWDGLFHVLTWVMTAIGLALLWSAVRQRSVPLSTKTLLGAMILGWGLFNLVEGVIDHHILHIHHVTETDNHLLWDLVFLGSGVVMIVAGWMTLGSRGADAVVETKIQSL